jgi:hypothetical protein
MTFSLSKSERRSGLTEVLLSVAGGLIFIGLLLKKTFIAMVGFMLSKQVVIKDCESASSILSRTQYSGVRNRIPKMIPSNTFSQTVLKF